MDKASLWATVHGATNRRKWRNSSSSSCSLQTAFTAMAFRVILCVGVNIYCSLSGIYKCKIYFIINSFFFLMGQFSSVAQSCLTLCDPMNHSTPGLPVHHHLPEFTQTHVHQVGDAIQPSHPLLSPSPPALNPSQHQSFFQWVNSSHEVAKVLEFQL